MKPSWSRGLKKSPAACTRDENLSTLIVCQGAANFVSHQMKPRFCCHQQPEPTKARRSPVTTGITTGAKP